MKNRKNKLVPEIRIQHGWLLQNAFMAYRNMIPKFRNKKIPTEEEAENIIKDRKKLWKKYEKKIIDGMRKITGLDFYADIIDVYIVHGWKSAFSSPMVMSMRYEKYDFIDVLTHELLHRILTDNTSRIDATTWIRTKFRNIKEQKVINHIMVHAIHKAIYLDVLKSPQRLKKDVTNCQEYLPYRKAWDIVEREGYRELIAQFKKYHNLD